MSIEVKPATAARFDDVATMVGPKSPKSSVCWCLSHRIDSKTNRELVGSARGEYVRKLCSRAVAPGILAYADDEVVGWAAVAPRSDQIRRHGLGLRGVRSRDHAGGPALTFVRRRRWRAAPFARFHVSWPSQTDP